IFDIGKTNKKLFVFNSEYEILYEKTMQLEETTDDDGHACEDLPALTQWVRLSITELTKRKDFSLTALNFSTYGASFVHLDHEGIPIAPLYNYLKPFPAALKKKFYKKYGGETAFSMLTASPVLGNLNSGLQLYYLKEEKPALFSQIHTSLHLPQYMSYLVTARLCSDITSIGCHTALWNFSKNHYHEWVQKEGIAAKLAPIFPSDQLMNCSWNKTALLCGAGLHDSSAALIPYIASFTEPFVLISTGTWCISLNPFNHRKLTAAELHQDCLCYMEYRGKPVKASRLFAGYEHEQQVKRLAAHFLVEEDFYKTIAFDPSAVARLSASNGIKITGSATTILQESLFAKRDLAAFAHYSDAYHQLMMDIMVLQASSTALVLKNCAVKKIFVDGGFSRNPIYMHLLAAAFPGIQVYAAAVAQASAIGAALAVHPYWNKNNFPEGLIELKLYADIEAIEL
ncbi:MAG TPA: FGGY family carbohydrate kinase, partial [Chitinophagaceae bacterium]|nr:FGGY family carbohydrate kinase [Chitinophagaceae bacterium]